MLYCYFTPWGSIHNPETLVFFMLKKIQFA
jgi:hypothetical protein